MKPRILMSLNNNPQFYIDAVEGVGGTAVAGYCPAVDLSCDGLLLCGGNDIDPSYYGEELAGAVKIDKPRDEAEFALAKAFLEAGKPVMGICRGFQLLNVYFGGTLYQHIEDNGVHRVDFVNYPAHPVTATPGSLLEKIYGGTFSVNSCHHQAVKDLGKGLIVTATAGAYVEGFVHECLPVLAVQWHPEKLCFSASRPDCVDGSKLIRAFVEMCK